MDTAHLRGRHHRIATKQTIPDGTAMPIESMIFTGDYRTYTSVWWSNRLCCSPWNHSVKRRSKAQHWQEILEIIDRIRIPLAIKKIDGERLSFRDECYLSMTETLVDRILNSISPIPEESSEVKTAMIHAKSLLKGANG